MSLNLPHITLESYAILTITSFYSSDSLELTVIGREDFDLIFMKRQILFHICFSFSFTSQWLMTNWRPLPATPLWWINTHDSNALWLFFILVHAVAWILIYAAALTMDLPELTGLKQVCHTLSRF